MNPLRGPNNVQGASDMGALPKGALLPGLNLFSSNHMEVLAHKLAETLSSPLNSPLEEEIVLVQSRGMERWISLKLAGHFGVCAQVRFPFPRVFIDRMFAELYKPDKTEVFFSPETLTWRILKLLPSLTKHDFADLFHFLNTGPDSFASDGPDGFNRAFTSWLKPLQLSERLAATFEKYLLFRPELLRAWNMGKEGTAQEKWQAHLWRRLFNPEDEITPLKTRERFTVALAKNGAAAFALPPRIALFGISSLPRFYLDIFRELADYIDVNIFFLNPSGEYWGDILSAREINRRIYRVREHHPGRTIRPEEHFLYQGNSLLASLGLQGRDYFLALLNISTETFDSPVDPGESTMLKCVQSDILNLRERGKEGQGKTPLDPGDRSIVIHSCHSPLREVEVLYDHILALFDEDPRLSPRDILVMTPDIDVYAPFIEAVFATPERGGKRATSGERIPFSLADRNVRAAGTLVNTFSRILALADSRYEAGECISLLESAPLRNKFHLAQDEVELIRFWLKETRIFWGIDGHFKKTLGLPPIYENTWRAGLDRLLLGYALPGEDKRLFQGVLPYDHIEGQEAETLGKLTEFLDLLFASTQNLNQKRTLSAWSEYLLKLLKQFFDKEHPASWPEINYLTDIICGLARFESEADFTLPIDFAAIKYFLAQSLDEGPGFGFLSGGVTFCALRPMRSIPFRVICLLGMDFATFPRESTAYGFDLTLKKPQRGDPSRRHDDRYLFLETLLSARDRFYISYIGQSIEDNSTLPPSTLVGELLDYLAQGFNHHEGNIRDQLLTRHRLQAFSPAYFQGNVRAEGRADQPETRLFSYSQDNLKAAHSLLMNPAPAFNFADQALSEPEEEWKTVTLDDLVAFYRHPTRYFLKRRLGVFLEGDEDVLPAKEIFTPAGLDRYLLDQAICQHSSAEESEEELFSVVKARGMLPHGTIGRLSYDQRKTERYRLEKRLSVFTEGTRHQPLSIDLSLDGFRLTGEIANLYDCGSLHQTLREANGRDHLKAWIYHVIINYLTKPIRPGNLPPEERLICPPVTLLVDKKSVWRYAPLEEPAAVLTGLMHCYWVGLKKPLKLFSRASWDYARARWHKCKSPREAMLKARHQWEGNDFLPGEGEDPYLKLCFGSVKPLDEEFEETAGLIYVELFKHLEELSND